MYVNTKVADRTKRDFYWFKIQEGWVPATTEGSYVSTAYSIVSDRALHAIMKLGGQRILQPNFDNTSPIAVSIVSTSFADPPAPGFWESVFFFLSTRLVCGRNMQ